MKRDLPIIGFFIGLFLPLLGIFITYLILFHGATFSGFVHAMMNEHSTAAKVLNLGILINLAPFIYCNTKRYDYTSRGIVIATMIYVVFILLIKFVW
ncbi:MAG: hypothetical protein H0X33_05795 [Taibaiella sp.]|nr:hypothetical protein [Taibaiella sp.]